MLLPDLVIRGHKVVTPDAVAPASVHIRNGVIKAIAAYDEIPQGCEVIDAGETSVVMPGLVDTHVHVNEPGRTEWEGFTTATRAAAAGGVTTLLDMPLNSVPPTTTLEGLDAKVRALEEKALVDVALCGGLVPGNVGNRGHEREKGGLRALFEEGVLAFKCFLAESGVAEFSHVHEAELRAGMAE